MAQNTIDLKKLKAEHPDCFENTEKFKAYLFTLYPEEKKAKINVLAIMVEQGVLDIVATGNLLDGIVFCEQLCNDYGFNESLVNECFALFAKSFSGYSTIVATKNNVQTELPPDYPTLDNYNEFEFEIEGTVLKAYRRNGKVVRIPYGVTEITRDVFKNCSTIENITIPDSVISIGARAFYGTAYYKNPNNWEDGVLYIGKHLIAASNELSECTIKQGTLTIADSAFSVITKDYELRDYVNSWIRTNLTSINIPDSVISIGKFAFCCCYNLDTVNIQDSVTSIGEYAFCFCKNLTSFKIPKCVKSIEYRTFSNCWSLANMIIPDGVTTICGEAFSHCGGLRSITIPNSVTTINSGTFSHCINLKNITIPDSISYIGSIAFENCRNLESLPILTGITTIEAGLFQGCISLTNVIIPNNITSIGAGAFGNCSNLTNIIIPNTVTSIGDYAFQKCINLTSITIPDSVITIGKSVFYECEKLSEVIIPNGVTTIGSSAFQGCKNLISITVPDSVTSIDSGAFALTAYSKKEENWEDNVLYVGKHLIDAKSNISGHYVIKQGTLTISAFAFSGHKQLTGITIPDSVITIGSFAFTYCSNLAIVNCEVTNKPENWSNNWINNCPAKVFWGYKGE